MNKPNTIETVATTIINGTKLTKETISAMGITKDELTQINAKVKELKKAARDKAYKAEHCTVEYNGAILPFDPRRVFETIEVNGKVVTIDGIIWKNVDRNGIILACAGENDSIDLLEVSRVGSKSKFRKFNDDAISKSGRFFIGVMKDVTVNETYTSLVTKCAPYKGFKIVTTPTSIKEYFIDRKSVKAVREAKKKKKKSN